MPRQTRHRCEHRTYFQSRLHDGRWAVEGQYEWDGNATGLVFWLGVWPTRLLAPLVAMGDKTQGSSDQ
jgi:hypothetical protein